MTGLPNTLEDAIAQARAATQAALADGYKRLQVELLFPELKPMPVAVQFLPVFEQYGSNLKIFFPDAGGAALAKREWADLPFKITDIGTVKTRIQAKIDPEDEIFLLIAPTNVEVDQVEKICELAGDRPVIMLNPFLVDPGKIGIGYASRQLNDRFLTTIESCYYLRPVDDETAIFRYYPGLWEVWVQPTGGEYQRIAELPKRPSGDELDLLLMQQPQTPDAPAARKPKLFSGLQRFLRALSG